MGEKIILGLWTHVLGWACDARWPITWTVKSDWSVLLHHLPRWPHVSPLYKMGENTSTCFIWSLLFSEVTPAMTQNSAGHIISTAIVSGYYYRFTGQTEIYSRVHLVDTCTMSLQVPALCLTFFSPSEGTVRKQGGRESRFCLHINHVLSPLDFLRSLEWFTWSI